jgi:flagellar biosynthesis protein FliR
MNVFIVGLPIQISIGLWVMGMSIGLIAYLLKGYFATMMQDIVIMLRMAGVT